MKMSLAENLRSLETRKQISGIRIGYILGVDETGRLLVDFAGNTEGPLPARFAESVKQRLNSGVAPSDEKVLLAFENEDPKLPIVVDLICDFVEMTDKADNIALLVDETDDVYVDGRRIMFDASEQIVLRCGKASITLTRAGKVLIRGAYVLNRSTGVNKMKGGSVQIN
jgi:hypothetical protein